VRLRLRFGSRLKHSVAIGGEYERSSLQLAPDAVDLRLWGLYPHPKAKRTAL